MPSTLNLIISSFWFKVKDVPLFLSLEHLKGHCRVITWPNFSTPFFGIGKPQQMDRDQWGWGHQWPVGGVDRMHTLSSLRYMGKVRGVPKQLQCNIKVHWSQITITNIIRKKLEIFWELLPKCDQETSEQMLLEKRHQQTCSWRVATNLQTVKNKVSVKYNEAKYNKRRYVSKYSKYHYS